MSITSFVVVSGTIALASCAATKHKSPANTPSSSPRFAPGFRVIRQAGASDSTTMATLVVRLYDLRGEALPHSLASLPELRMGLLTIENGSGRLELPPGDWLVRWRVDGAVPPGIDSTRVHFEPGRAETLEVHVEMWHETPRDIWNGRTPLPKARGQSSRRR